ncbi:hypothetical protein ASF49_09555 [Methylobacterium sp. Leaf104]|uniref:hypothetical protein n=1 Tax=Methylobacterium TaxID=407 RepID=UPI0006F8069D|nr:MULTISPECIES: hypothetical protein [Methylobacterium]KQP31679.1 hypothetical protein ASF49_09555 [Methylobacterium sp. Leaf104]MCI9880587.1 hypothetical protein [Methylobacterium goesingense]
MASAADAGPSACADPARAGRHGLGRHGLGCALGTAVSGLLALLFLVCAMLPLLQGSGDAPRGFERHAAMAATTVPNAPDLLARISVGMVDLDEAAGSVSQQRIVPIGRHEPKRLGLPRAAVDCETRAISPLERPPRRDLLI